MKLTKEQRQKIISRFSGICEHGHHGEEVAVMVENILSEPEEKKLPELPTEMPDVQPLAYSGTEWLMVGKLNAIIRYLAARDNQN